MRHLDSLPASALPPGTRVLWAGVADPPVSLRSRGWTVTVLPDSEELSFADGSFDLVIGAGCCGEYEWDRWLLQELQRVLVPSGRLVLLVPNLLSLAGPADWLFLMERALVQLDRRLRRFLGRPQRDYKFRGRRYSIARFLELLPPLGFVDIACEPAAGPPRQNLLTSDFVVTARSGASRFGGGAGRPYPDSAAHVSRYSAANAQVIATRDRWLEEHPGFGSARCAPLDPEQYAGASVIVLAPHPDDEVIGCGGTLARMVKAGARVTCLQATDGSEGAALRDFSDSERRSVRLEEAAAVSRAIGFAETVFWREDNGNFRITPELIERMRSLLVSVKPVAVFTPFVADLHPDHFTLNRILAGALRSASERPSIFQYEVWGLVPANRYCDVTEESERLESLLRLYRTAMKVDDFVHFCEDRNLFHSIRLAGRDGLAEAFLESSAADFVRVVTEQEAGSVR